MSLTAKLKIKSICNLHANYFQLNCFLFALVCNNFGKLHLIILLLGKDSSWNKLVNLTCEGMCELKWSLYCYPDTTYAMFHMGTTMLCLSRECRVFYHIYVIQHNCVCYYPDITMFLISQITKLYSSLSKRKLCLSLHFTITILCLCFAC